MINLIVVGGGEGFYKNLDPAIQSPELKSVMRIATVIDILPLDQLHEETQKIIRNRGIRYANSRTSRDEDVQLGDNPAVIIMTPNDSHMDYARRFSSMKKDLPIDVEKPVATRLSDVEDLLTIAKQGRIYAAEPTVDGKCLGLLWAAGAVPDDDPRIRYLETDLVGAGHWTVQDYFRSLGRLRYVCGAMLEGTGKAGTADHRPWLLEGKHGGMIRDLASHLFGALYDIGMGSSDIRWEEVELGRYDHGMDLGKWRPLRQWDEGETHAKMRGVMFSPCGEIQCSFEVGKYWPSHCRFLNLTFEHGLITLSYERPFELTIETNHGTVSVKNKMEQYQILTLIDFKEFIDGKASGHIGRAAAIVRFNEMARQFGVRQQFP